MLQVSYPLGGTARPAISFLTYGTPQAQQGASGEGAPCHQPPCFKARSRHTSLRLWHCAGTARCVWRRRPMSSATSRILRVKRGNVRLMVVSLSNCTTVTHFSFPHRNNGSLCPRKSMSCIRRNTSQSVVLLQN